MNKFCAVLIVAMMMLIACQGKVNITEATYEPKLFIQGVLVPGELPRIAIRRNFPLNDPLIEPSEIPLTDPTSNGRKLKNRFAKGVRPE